MNVYYEFLQSVRKQLQHDPSLMPERQKVD